jgi:very-short-patch-repair endonuclease
MSAVTGISELGQLIDALANGERARVAGPSRLMSAKCSKIKVVATDIQRMSGQHALFIGYPLLFADVEGKAPVLAPLFLIPVSISRTSADAIELSGGAIRVNPLLPEWCKIYRDIQLSVESQSTVYSTIDDEERRHPMNWQAMATAVLHPWLGIEGLEDIGSREFESAPSAKTVRLWQAEGRPGQVLNAAVLGIARFNGQALLDDLTQLANKSVDSMGAMLLSLVGPRKERHQPAADCLPDHSRWSVIETDPAQDRAIAQLQISDCMVVQGPPGTGKSQTIVNMISQALASGKAIAVFCEKRAALEVVIKRMKANGLGHLCQLIDDPVGQRQAIIKSTKSIDRDLGNPQINSSPAKHRLESTSIETLENKIDQRMAAFFPSEEPVRERYADLRSRLLQLSPQQGIGLQAFREIKSALTDRQLDISNTGITELFLREVAAWQKAAEACNFGKSPWRALRTDSEIDLELMHDWLRSIEEHWLSTVSVPPVELHWLNIHCLARRWAGTFLDSNSRNAHLLLSAAAVALDRLKCMTGIGPNTSLEVAEALHTKAPIDFTAPHWKETLGQAGNVHALSRALAEDTVGAVLRTRYGSNSEQWLDIVKAAIYDNMLGRLQREFPRVYSGVGLLKQDIEQLRQSLDDHRKSSRLFVLSHFQSRVGPMQKLKDRDLLRERGHSATGTKKSEIRGLYSAAGFDSMRKLHPVLLSTPEVACALLPLTAGLFDLVIVDEASQMFVAEALPLVFRGKQVMIAGDSKQMPPSDFFTADVGDDGDEDDGDDQVKGDAENNQILEPTLIPALDGESILEAAESALAAGSAAQRMLEMHYRSAFAELIEFSNHAFYEGRLLAPPGNPAATAVLPKPITLYSVHGTFSKGLNRLEAEEIVRFLSHLWQEENSPSIGIIVMNVAQRDHIETLLQGQAQEDSTFAARLEIERNRKEDGEDVGLFVRAVEHVQGDERDLIVFGTTYAAGRRYGPISEASRGRRRLNVAITRAKKGMAVFCSLNIPQMASDADKGTDRWYFQQYLRYAEAVSNGDGPKVSSILEVLNPSVAEAKKAAMFDSPFEEEVEAFLAEAGYECELQKPETEFRIDLAVKRRNGLGYICGIECDGAQYHAGWRARTRDIWRQQILESKGWHIERVWSTDWFQDPDNTKSKLMEVIRRLEAEFNGSLVPLTFQPRMMATSDYAATSTQSSKAPAPSAKSVTSMNSVPQPPAAAVFETRQVQIGDTVTFKYVNELMPRHVKIVPMGQPCDRANGIIWPKDPLALALLGFCVGDKPDVLLPTGSREAEILEIQ